MSNLISKIQYTATAVDDIQKALEELGANVTNANLLEYGDIIRNLFKNAGTGGGVSNKNTVKLNAFILKNNVVFFRYVICGYEIIPNNIVFYNNRSVFIPSIKNGTISVDASKIHEKITLAKMMYQQCIILTNNIENPDSIITNTPQYQVNNVYEINQNIQMFMEDNIILKEES